MVKSGTERWSSAKEVLQAGGQGDVMWLQRDARCWR